MKTRKRKLYFSLLSLAMIFTLMGVSQSVAAEKPNILVIWGDDIGQSNISAYTMGMMGYRTPNIDRIAKEGAILKNTFVTNSICAPSRAVLLTGKYSHINGLKDNSPKRKFDGAQQQIQKLLSANNYQTACANSCAA